MLATESRLLDDLNPEQKEAVLQTEGRVLVLAGAGSGKTKVLTTRIAYLREQKVDPWRILAITFTNKASKEMKDRVYKLDREAYRCWIGTFHSVCTRILLMHLDDLGIERFTTMDESDQQALVKKAASSLGLEVDKSIAYNMLSQISFWKNEMVTPGEAMSANHDKKDKANIARVYELYETLKYAHNYFDFDDLLMQTVHLFQTKPEVLGKFQNLFRYILVDEFQDTNRVQFKLIEMLSNKHGNLFLVGDADQSIYSFRSAKVENILKYTQMHPDTKLITLQKNYRSTQKIVNASNALVSHNQLRLDREAVSVGAQGDDIHIMRFNDASREADFVSRLIVNLRKNEKRKWSDFAVLYRMNFQSRHLELALRDENIPYRIIGSISFYDRKEIKDVLSYVRACHNLNDDIALKKIINVPKRSIGDKTVEKISIFADERKISFFTALQNIDQVAEQFKINKGTVVKIKEFTALIMKLSAGSRIEPFSATEFIHKLLTETKFLAQFDKEKEEDEARLENISHLGAYARYWDSQERDNQSLAQFVTEISLDGDREDDEGEEDYVVLTSVHSAKGLEWSQVFLIGLEDDVFPHFRSKGSREEIEEERRLMYVAMTRAAERLFISHSAYKFEYNSHKPIKQNPSPFLGEIPQYLTTVLQQTI